MFSEFNYLKKTIRKNPALVDNVIIPPRLQSKRGIPHAKKESIINTSVPIIKATYNDGHSKHATFFPNIDVSDDVADLAIDDDKVTDADDSQET